MKNRNGSTLILVLLTLVVLSILGTTLLNIMLTNKKQEIIHEDKIKSYYIARSGAEIVEARLSSMDYDHLRAINDRLNSGEDEIKMNIDLKKNEINYLDNSNLEVILTKENEDDYSYLLTSTGTYNKSSETIRKSLSKSNYDGNHTETTDPEDHIILDNSYTSGKNNNIINGNKFKKGGKYLYKSESNDELIINLVKDLESEIYVYGNVKIYTGNNDDIKLIEKSKITATGDIIIYGKDSNSNKFIDIIIDKSELKAGGNLIVKAGKNKEVEVKESEIKSKNVKIISTRKGKIYIEDSKIETNSLVLNRVLNGKENIIKEFNEPVDITYEYEKDDYEIEIKKTKLIKYEDESSNNSNDNNKNSGGFYSYYK